MYSESDHAEESNMPPDPSTKSEGQPPDDVDFSEEEQTASSSNSASSSSASSASSASASSASSARSAGGAQASSGSPASSSGAPNEAPASSSERVADLDSELDATMATYDGMILRGRDYVRNRPSSSKEQEESMDEPPPDESLEDLIQSAEAELPAPPGGEGGSGPEQNNSSGQATGPGLPTAGRKGEYNHSGTTPVVPADIPDGNDDDVVARQIREAATRESDPELREKLWAEYRKYKNAQK